MGTKQSHEQKLADLETAVDQERTEVQSIAAGLVEQIRVLNEQLTAGTQVTSEDLDAMDAKVDQIIAKVSGISEA